MTESNTEPNLLEFGESKSGESKSNKSKFDTPESAQKSSALADRFFSSLTDRFSFFLKTLQALCVAALCFCAIATFIIPGQYSRFIIYDAALLAGFIFLFLLNGQIADFTKDARVDLKGKAGLYFNLLPQQDASEDSPDKSVKSREIALEYCQELIDDYKKVRVTSRTYYYVFQIATIVLSGVTLILVLLDKQVTLPYLKWLPVIFPAVAAVVTSVATSFPFQERWINANSVVEKLEAEREKFVLGVTEPYRAFIFQDEKEIPKKIKLSIENFIIAVNKIHLKQVEATSSIILEQEQESAENR